MTDETAEPKMARPKRRVLRWFGLSVLAVLVLIAAGAWRATEGYVTLPGWIVARIEARLDRDLGARDLALGAVAFGYDLEAQALRLRLRDVALRRAETTELALPEARIALDGRALASGRLRPRVISVEGLSLEAGRDADGRFSLAVGQGGGALPASWDEGLAALDAALALPAVADLRAVTVEGVELRLSDAITGLSQDVEDGVLTWRREAGSVEVALAVNLPAGGGRSAALSVMVERGGTGARAEVALDALPIARMAAMAPQIAGLSLVSGDISAEAAMSIGEDGSPGPLTGQLELRDGQLTDQPDLALDRAILAFSYAPGGDRIALTEISAGSDDVFLRADGQVLLEDGLTGPIQLQFRLGETVFDPEGMFDRRVAFDQGVFEARLVQAPLGLRIGQAMVTGPSGTARLSGEVAFPDDGLAGTLRLVVPEMAVEELMALWPPDLQPEARTWMARNMLAGTAREATALVRLTPGAPPEALASFSFEDGSFRYMRHMPPAEGATGAAQLEGTRFSLRVDEASVPARAEGWPDGGRIDIAGSTFTILDATQRPARGTLRLQADGAIGDVLTLLDNRPFRLLERIRKGPDLARGQASALVRVELPLRPGNAPADISYDVEARLSEVESDDIVPGRRLSADGLALRAGAELVEIGGEMRLQGVPFVGRWRQALPPPSTVPIDPDAQTDPVVELPEPGRVTGVARISPEGLAGLGIDLSALGLSGAANATISVTLPAGAPPQLVVDSDLVGLSARLPAIGWRKAADRPATLELAATLDAIPNVTRLALDTPGLAAEGRVSLRPEGGLAEARFDRVSTGWFQGAVRLTGRGGAPPAIAVTGGRADLRRAPFDGESGGDGAGSPVRIALNRLQVTEGIALTDMRAELQNGAGPFSGAINGGTRIEGRLASGSGGATVQINGSDAGGVLRSSGLFEDARGGQMGLTLRATGRTGQYAGALRIANLRVRNAPALASLLQALSVVGILEQLSGDGLPFATVESDFTIRPDDIVVRRASAVGPSMSITADGVYDIASKRMDMQGVISPIYLVNGLFGALFSRRDEGLFGFTYRLTGRAADPQVSVNPLSILTPGVFREIFRRAPPTQ
ncbi:MAG: AsmA-like C-terminal region-containing protein [Pseudomonadota bacterium]